MDYVSGGDRLWVQVKRLTQKSTSSSVETALDLRTEQRPLSPSTPRLASSTGPSSPLRLFGMMSGTLSLASIPKIADFLSKGYTNSSLTILESNQSQ